MEKNKNLKLAIAVLVAGTLLMVGIFCVATFINDSRHRSAELEYINLINGAGYEIHTDQEGNKYLHKREE